jgi:hypothetical protein
MPFKGLIHTCEKAALRRSVDGKVRVLDRKLPHSQGIGTFF